MTWSMLFCMISLPRPAGTSFSNTSSKYLETCLNVRSIASSFLWSKVAISPWILFADFSRSSRRLRSSSRCLVKFEYCSKAFLLTWPNFFSVSFTAWSFFTSYKGAVHQPRVLSHIRASTDLVNFDPLTCILLKRFLRQNAEISNVFATFVLARCEHLAFGQVPFRSFLLTGKPTSVFCLLPLKRFECCAGLLNVSDEGFELVFGVWVVS
jgi:hypothetical protein